LKSESTSIGALRKAVITCERCPRLVSYRERVKPRASFAGQDYWRRPVPGFGDIKGRLFILGLAPAAHGGFRTGRIFTGDESGRFLVRALFRTGFANKPVSEGLDDGLVYTDCYLTAAVKCAPPGDKPTGDEFANCSTFLEQELALLPNLRIVLALGKLAFDSFIRHAKNGGASTNGVRFAHGAAYAITGMPKLWASYHPSPRNTNTGTLTQQMLVGVLLKIKRELAASPAH